MQQWLTMLLNGPDNPQKLPHPVGRSRPHPEAQLCMWRWWLSPPLLKVVVTVTTTFSRAIWNFSHTVSLLKRTPEGQSSAIWQETYRKPITVSAFFHSIQLQAAAYSPSGIMQLVYLQWTVHLFGKFWILRSLTENLTEISEMSAFAIDRQDVLGSHSYFKNS